MTGCADLNGDGRVNFADLGVFKSQFGESAEESAYCPITTQIEATLTSPALRIDGTPISGIVTLRIVRTADECWKALLVDEEGRASEAVIACRTTPPSVD